MSCFFRVPQVFFLVSFGFISPLVAMNNLDLVLAEDDENSSQCTGRAAYIPMATEAWESQSWNEFGNIEDLFAKQTPDVSQQPGLFCWHCSCLQHPPSDLPIFPPPYSNSPFKSFLPPSSKTHNLTYVHFLFLLSLSLSLRLWCWQIQSLRAACLSALMREPVTRGTASLSTSWAFYSTPLKRTGP